MEVKTSDLTLLALDWAVAKCEGLMMGKIAIDGITQGFYKPSTNWAQGGPIIERERIRIDCPWNPGPFEATCKIDGVTAWTRGPTVLIAAMRCYVTSKLGDDIEVPTELLGD